MSLLWEAVDTSFDCPVAPDPVDDDDSEEACRASWLDWMLMRDCAAERKAAREMAVIVGLEDGDDH